MPRILLVAALLAYLALAVATGLDRIAASDPRFASLVPQPAQVAVLAARADRFVEAGIPGSALDDAALLIARDPLGTHAAGLLGAARLARGDPIGADAAYRVSARLGWRDARTQLYWLRAALAQQDHDRAALRFGALARQWPGSPAIASIATVIEATAAGRTALARRIAAGDRWAPAYAVPPADAAPAVLAGRAAVLGEAAALGKRLGCEPSAALVRALAPVDSGLALRLWQGQCPDHGQGGLLRDADFASARLQQALTPFGWNFSAAGALDLRLAPTGSGGQVLTAVNSGAINRLLAAQQVVIQPGAYRLRLRGSFGRGRVFAALACNRDNVPSRPEPWADRPDGLATGVAFAGGCTAPWLQLWLAPGTETALTDLQLTRR